MDRSYLAPHNVTVFATQSDRPHKPVKVVQAVPYPNSGFVYYVVDGKMYPGYAAEDNDPTAAVVYLDRPLRRFGI